MMDVFEEHKVSFVSVTQHFDTTSAMGRLTLNILLSFASFERDMTGERIRDKFATSKKKGMWMGGRPPLGYDVIDRKLEVNKKEAKQVNDIYKQFVQIGSATTLVKQLKVNGVTTKSWTNQRGFFNTGNPFDKGVLYKLLRNKIYLGKTTHKEQVYEGQHNAIVTQRLWDQVQIILETNSHQRSQQTKAQTQSLLKGLLFDEEGNALSPTFCKNHGKLYRYYTSTKAIKNNYDDSPVKNMPAGEIEAIVINQVKEIFKTPEWLINVWKNVNQKTKPKITEKEIKIILNKFSPIWGQLFPAEQARLIQLLVKKIIINDDKLILQMHRNDIAQFALELNTIH